MRTIAKLMLLLLALLTVTNNFVALASFAAPAFAEEFIYAHIGQEVLTIKPENNSSAKAFINMLQKKDLMVDMHDYGNFEKVGSISSNLPRNDKPITTKPGDVILYQGNQITIYYDENSWNFTKLGEVQGVEQQELKSILGEGNVLVRFSLRKNS